MNWTTVFSSELRTRNLQYFTSPRLWPHWPLLPLMRRRLGLEEEYGVIFDAKGTIGLPGYSATVLFSNLFELPCDPELILQLPKEVFDTPEEMFAAGWRVD